MEDTKYSVQLIVIQSLREQDCAYNERGKGIKTTTVSKVCLKLASTTLNSEGFQRRFWCGYA